MKRRLVFFVIFVVIAIVAGVAIIMSLNAVKNADFYDFGSDKIASVKTVLGTRSVGGISSSTADGIATKSYEYRSNLGAQDIESYTAYLTQSEGFVSEGDVYAKPSVEDGKILKLEIVPTEKGFRITITKENAQ